MTSISPFLTFGGNAEEALQFYMSVFPDARMVNAQKSPDGSVLFSGTFELGGQQYMILNGDAHFKFTSGFSLFISCDTQQEVDDLWERLSDGGEKGRCGWLKDRFGMSWQVVPAGLGRLLGDPDRARAQRAMNAMLQMNKLDLAVLEQAAQSA
ncbi:VOC family protein [Deinococcus sonorensis]|uniref:VOC family protein n=2 Tax=Deinococcus sonorensis TaxID=309891 RepID=A0AAU7U7Q5_9DEIO